MGWELAADVKRADVPSNVRAVLFILCDVCAFDDPDRSYASVTYLAYESGYSTRQVQNILRWLEDKKYITCLTRGVGRGNTNRYRIHIERIPLRPKWRVTRSHLIELGELEDESASFEVVHAAYRRLKRRRAEEQAEWDAAQEQGQEQEQ